MSVTRYVTRCQSCTEAVPCTAVGLPCPRCGVALTPSQIRRRTAYAGEALIGAYGSGPPERPWPEIKDGPLKGQNVVEGGLKALKDWGKRTGVEWQ